MPIEIISELVAKNSGQFALLDDSAIRGGFRVCATLTDRDNISSDKRKEGMLAFVISTGLIYELQSDLVGWSPLDIGTDISGLVLSAVLVGYTLGSDGTDLISTDTILQAFQKLQVQIHNKLNKPIVTYLTGTSVLDESISIVIINSPINCTIFLPANANNISYRIRNVGPGRVTLQPNGSDTVERSSSFIVLTTNAFDLVCYSNNWYIL